MKATLYDALGIQPTSTDEEVRAALRGLIRKYYAKTRDGQGNVEEALRFINHASRILSDSERRQRYDQDLMRSAVDEDLPSREALDKALAGDDPHTEVGPTTTSADGAIEDPLDSRLPEDDEDVPATHHPGLTQRVARFTRSPVLTFGLCAAYGAFIAAAIVFVTPPNVVVVARSVLGWLTLAFAVLAAIFGAVHGGFYLRRRQASTRSALVPQTDLGTDQPQEDASWIFQLRMAELERAKSGRTSEPRPWHRLAARLFDYAIWGLLLALLLSQLRAAGAIPPDTAAWLTHPLVAPILITLSFVPIEALLITAVGTTPGKWLFGIYLQFSISNAYARRDTGTQLRRALARAVRVWLEGVGCGFPLLAPLLVALAYERLIEHQETNWDFAEDCLVTHGPAGVVNTVTGVCGLASMMWLYGVAWQQPMTDALAWVNAQVARALPSKAALEGRMTDARGGLGRLVPSLPPIPTTADVIHRSSQSLGLSGTPNPATTAPGVAGRQDTSDADFAAMMAARRARIDLLKAEGPRMLRAGNPRRAAELCRNWAELDLANADAWRCLGRAQEALGDHQQAVNSFRKARQHDPGDRTLDAAIEGAQRGIVADFLNRYRR
jgi:uncharacterized RDD family membrane protein YckC